MQDIRVRLRKLERRDWWLWWAAIAVMLLLTAAVVSNTLPLAWKEDDIVFQLHLTQAVRGLVGVVLLFVAYMSYQRALVRRLHGQLAEQLKMMAKLEVRAEEFEKLAILDPLTGLYNRRFAEQRLAEEVARAHRSGRPLTVLIIDLDDFKQINDCYGHATGDLVLKEFSQRLERVIRVADVAVRLGGDEFLALLPEFRQGQVQDLLMRLHPVEVEVGGRKLAVGFSAGWAAYQLGERPEQLLERADESLYARKRTAKPAGPTVSLTAESGKPSSPWPRPE